MIFQGCLFSCKNNGYGKKVRVLMECGGKVMRHALFSRGSSRETVFTSSGFCVLSACRSGCQRVETARRFPGTASGK